MCGLYRPCIALQQASPAEVVDEILGGYPMETPHPALQPAVVGINVLNMKGARPHALPGPGMYHLMRDTAALGERGIYAGTVCTQDRLGVDQRLECRLHMASIELAQAEIGGVPLLGRVPPIPRSDRALCLAWPRHRHAGGVAEASDVGP